MAYPSGTMNVRHAVRTPSSIPWMLASQVPRRALVLLLAASCTVAATECGKGYSRLAAGVADLWAAGFVL